MAKKPRLRMTGADYVAIAVSPALIMALVGSLVFFLIEVVYIGQYHARLNYAFAWFVFATVLIGRIAIEMGSERAVMFALPLGLAMFAVMAKFVPHASPFSHAINLGLMGIVWWSAHKLTWDCTLIDDNEDASGEGLMQKIGSDDFPTSENELLREESNDKTAFSKHGRRHAPGLWVLYFSLAALPLFGIGQKWIPVADVGRRQYAFGLLAIYVAAGLTLLVTTSFLGLRRYLRQRRIEMPTPMAATWVVTGAMLIVATMLLAAVIPRPQAEYAISQVPWQADSPDELSASRVNFGEAGTKDEDATGRKVTNDETDPNADAQREGDNPTSASDEGEKQTSGEGEQSQSQNQSQNQSQSQSESNDDSQSQQQGETSDEPNKSSSGETSDSQQSENQSPSDQEPAESTAEDSQSEAAQQSAKENSSESSQAQSDEQTPNADPSSTENSSSSSSPSNPLSDLVPQLGGLTNLVKWILYAVMALVIGYVLWTRRREIRQAIVDFVCDLKALLARLFGSKPKPTANESDEQAEQVLAPPTRPFASFEDPFASGKHRGLPPDELVRYTFEAFEAWARDQGHTRTPDQTPLELVHQAVSADSPILTEAQRMARLYNEAAYAPRNLSPSSVKKLASLWSLLRQSAQTPVESAS